MVRGKTYAHPDSAVIVAAENPLSKSHSLVVVAGMGAAYAKFQNVPRAILVDGDEGAVLSHISALAAQYPDEPIEADVMNYFRLRDGKISYMQNVHDSKPFAPFLKQISGG